jgi:hypothetical protein
MRPDSLSWSGVMDGLPVDQTKQLWDLDAENPRLKTERRRFT